MFQMPSYNTCAVVARRTPLRQTINRQPLNFGRSRSSFLTDVKNNNNNNNKNKNDKKGQSRCGLTHRSASRKQHPLTILSQSRIHFNATTTKLPRRTFRSNPAVFNGPLLESSPPPLQPDYLISTLSESQHDSQILTTLDSMEGVSDYNSRVEKFRELEYPMLKDAVYLDHAGTTLYSKSLVDRFASDMISNLYGNPHSASASSQLSTNRVEDARLSVLQFFKADPEFFDVVFVANATAGIKLVMDAFQSQENGFIYGYHQDSHTSLVGVRENAKASRCLDDEAVEWWLSGDDNLVDGEVDTIFALFAYPAQSNLNGRRLPLSWLQRARGSGIRNQPMTYTLLDASAFVSTSQLDLSDHNSAADFTVLSFYKIFGFPDLGALIIRKESGEILRDRKYFGGGTVDMVVCVKEKWHALKGQTLHDSLEDGTLPFHSIMALEAAMDVHKMLYLSMDRIAKHTAFLAQKLYAGLQSLKHANSESVCVMHSDDFNSEDFRHRQGPVVTFNIRNSYGAWVSNSEIEKLASVQNFHIRTGGLCNPGGIASSLSLEPWEMRQNFSAGFKCSSETDIYSGKITGVVRASIGAMSILSDVEAFISFVKEFYTESGSPRTYSDCVGADVDGKPADLTVESLTVYPIKSCGGLSIPPGIDWEVRPEGLAWDREWCLVHQGTGHALNQKRHPRMALIRPTIDFQAGLLRVRYHGSRPVGVPEEVFVPLSADPSFYMPVNDMRSLSSMVCGDAIKAYTYSNREVNDFFSRILGVSCALARFPAGGASTRHSKAHLQKHQGITVPPSPPESDNDCLKRPILLSNESPILVINRSSIDALNKEIIKAGGKPASASVFRANIVLDSSDRSKEQQPYSEDHWTSLRIGEQEFQMLGSCRRCHMICVDQDTAEKNEEPFVTLAKTRRFDSKIFFGSHMSHVPSLALTRGHQYPTIRVRDVVRARVEEASWPTVVLHC